MYLKKLILITIFLSPLITLSQTLTFTSSTPATASNTVSLDSDITLTFDTPIKTSTLNATNFKLGEVITVTLTSALENTSGGALSLPRTFSFTTINAATPSPVFTAADIANRLVEHDLFLQQIWMGMAT